MPINEIFAIILWILIFILIIGFGFYLFSYFKYKKNVEKTKEKFKIYNNYQKKYSNYNVDYLVKNISIDHPEIKTYTIREAFDNWNAKQKKWLELIVNATEIAQTMSINKLNNILKKIDKVEKKMIIFGDSINNIFNNSLKMSESKNFKAKVLPLNEALEEFYNYLSKQKIYDEQNFKNIQEYKHKVDTQMKYLYKSLNKQNQRLIELLNNYADKLINYYQFLVTINHFSSLENKISELIKNGNYNSDFSVELQRHANIFKKISNDITSMTKDSINPTWLFIDVMNNKLNKNNLSKETKEWYKNNYLQIEKLIKSVVSIYEVYNKFKNSKNKIFQAINLNEWYQISEKIFQSYNEITKIKNSSYVIENKQEILIENYINILNLLNQWILLSNRICVDISSQFNYQLLINNQKISLLNAIEFFDQNNIDTKLNLMNLKQKLNSIHFPYSNLEKQIINNVSQSVLKINDKLYKSESIKMLAIELRKHQLLNTNQKYLDQSIQINELYDQNKYFDYIEKYISTFK